MAPLRRILQSSLSNCKIVVTLKTKLGKSHWGLSMTVRGIFRTLSNIYVRLLFQK